MGEGRPHKLQLSKREQTEKRLTEVLARIYHLIWMV